MTVSVGYYVITLDSTPERTARAKAQFEKENVPVTWVYGVDAVAFGIKPSLPMHKNTTDGSPYFITANACALVLSHYMAFRLAELDCVDEFFIFEDDVILPEDFLGKWAEIRREVPQDVLAVWCEYCCVDPSRMEKVSAHLRRALPMCTAAVWYKKETIPICLKAIQPAHAPVDILLQQRACGELKSCVVDPQMCFQERYNDTVNSTIHRVLPTEPPGYIA